MGRDPRLKGREQEHPSSLLPDCGYEVTRCLPRILLAAQLHSQTVHQEKPLTEFRYFVTSVRNMTNTNGFEVV